jgi:hypothetical protein
VFSERLKSSFSLVKFAAIFKTGSSSAKPVQSSEDDEAVELEIPLLDDGFAVDDD